jgi:hypothetical protein
MRQFWHAIPAALAIALSSLLLPSAVDAKAIWSSQPATGSRLMREGFALGNGKLGGINTSGICQGSITDEISNTIRTAWSGKDQSEH